LVTNNQQKSNGNKRLNTIWNLNIQKYIVYITASQEKWLIKYDETVTILHDPSTF